MHLAGLKVGWPVPFFRGTETHDELFGNKVVAAVVPWEGQAGLEQYLKRVRSDLMVLELIETSILGYFAQQLCFQCGRLV